ADRLANLIDNLLEASQLQAGGLQLNHSTIDIVTLTNKLTKKFKTQTEKHTFNVSFADNFPKPIADEERILQALSNLISNAIKYSPNGGPITVSGKYTNREIIISVKDSGIGVEAGDLNKIFDRFHRVADTETSHTQGAGLGLYLTRAIIEAHHGRIWVDSDPGLGSTFHIAIPIEE
ncbi:MAG TPA: histidine kinase, partial [Chloroflexi bacterium]|nr:histidine kinase [Chloroflexota bacterium]